MQIKTKIVSSHTADSKPVKQEVNGTMILPPLVFPWYSLGESNYGIASTRSFDIGLASVEGQKLECF